MNISKIFLFTLLVAMISFPESATSQESTTDALHFEVNRVYKPLSISTETLNQATTLSELNRHYESSWVKEYVSVEVLTRHNGEINRAIGTNDILSQEQINNLKQADFGSEIWVKVAYIPDNTLTKNDVKQNNFSFTVDPVKEAEYIGGNQELRQYLKDNAIDKIPEGSYGSDELFAINFTVDETGQIVNVHVFDPIYRESINENADNILIEAILNMQSWKPAEYSDGTKTNQDFVLTIGNMENCVVNLLNIRKGLASRE